MHGNAHQDREQGRQRGAAEQAAPQDVIGKEVQKDAQRAHTQHVRGRIVPVGEQTRQGRQQVGHARILREKRRHRVTGKGRGAFPGFHDLRVVLQVAVHADALGIEVQRPLQGTPAEQRGQQDQKQIRKPVSFVFSLFHSGSPSLDRCHPAGLSPGGIPFPQPAGGLPPAPGRAGSGAGPFAA